MGRVRIGAARRRKHKRILKDASGYYGSVHRRYALAKQKTFRAGVMATADRRRRKRDFRRLWITRITAACKMRGLMYSRLIHAMELQNVIINRKMLSEIAIAEPAAFDAIVAATLGKMPKETPAAATA
jgi:large subunit ribosomal protein L20